MFDFLNDCRHISNPVYGAKMKMGTHFSSPSPIILPFSHQKQRGDEINLIFPLIDIREPMGRIELPSMVYETIALPLSYIGKTHFLTFLILCKNVDKDEFYEFIFTLCFHSVKT